MIDTPRTDCLFRKLIDLNLSFFDALIKMCLHSRKLERELVAVTKERDEARSALCDCADYYHDIWGDEAGTSWRNRTDPRAIRWCKAAGI